MTLQQSYKNQMDIKRRFFQRQYNEEVLVIGTAQFRQEFDEKKEKKYITSQITQRLSHPEFNLCKIIVLILSINNLYVKQNWSKILIYIEQFNIKKMMISVCQKVSMLKELAFPNYSLLTHITLADSQIFNIEAIAFMRMQNIKQLKLVRNCITQLKPINKLKLHGLQSVNLIGNPIQTIELNRTQLNQFMKELNFQSMEEICFMAKFFAVKIYRAWFLKYNRIRQKKRRKVLENKFENISFSAID